MTWILNLGICSETKPVESGELVLEIAANIEPWSGKSTQRLRAFTLLSWSEPMG